MQKENIKIQKRELVPFLLLSIAMIMSFSIWKNRYEGVPLQPPAPVRAAIIGKAAPNFTLPDINGIKQTLSDLKGKFVFLNIWATWCKPCRDEMPSMQKLYDKFKDTDFQMLAVSIDEAGENAVVPFVEKYKITFPVLLDPDGITSRLYETTGVPETFLIDRNGTVVHKVVGPSDWSRQEWLHSFETILLGDKNKE